MYRRWHRCIGDCLFFIIVSHTSHLSRNCTTCPAGFACPNLNSATVNPCYPGSYSVMGQASCTQCPAGYACPSQHEPLRIACPSGSYSLAGAQVRNHLQS